jgi:hypothetical protein
LFEFHADFILCYLSITKGIIKQINLIIRQCLWRKKEPHSKGQSLENWDMISKPRNNAGLGILNYKKQDEKLSK